MERNYTTQMDAARRGIVTPELEAVARKEQMRVEELMPLVASGKVVIPANKLHTCISPEGVGSMLRTKINVNLGVSRDCKDYDVEMQKVLSAVNMGAEAIMDLSSHGDTQPFRRKLTSECPAMIGTVPVYDSVIHYQRDLDTLSAKDFIDVVRLHAQDGVDFVTLHCGITRKTIDQIRKHKRKMNIVSRGGSLVFAWMCMTGEENLEDYLAAKNQAVDLLEGCQVIDALSSLEFYRRGVVEQPVCANDHIQPFLDAKADPLWVYYCCSQSYHVPNRFFAMPSARNRIMGVLMYLYHLKGFLQWGYNFYYTQFSRSLADPFAMTHCNYAFPSGDAYLVYPGPGGEPLTSLRAEVQSEGLMDLRALYTLEARIGREAVQSLVLDRADMDVMTFTKYPTSAEYLLSLREAVFEALEQE